MPVTGVYFIHAHPNSSTVLATITERLRSTFTNEDLVPTGRWAMEHRLFRDTPGLLPPTASSPQTQPLYMQFLSLTHYPAHGFIYTSIPDEKAGQLHNVVVPPSNPAGTSAGAAVNAPQAATPSLATVANAQVPDAQMQMTTLPMSSFNTMFQHFIYACQPFWCHRLTFTVPSGVVYDVGDFRIRLGDVRQTYPTARVRGTIVEIEWRGPSVVDAISTTATKHQVFSDTGVWDDGDSGIELDVDFSVLDEADVDAEYTATAGLIHEFWSSIGIEGAREAILVPGIGKEVKARLGQYKNGKISQVQGDPMAGADVARQYLEVLRLNR